MTVQQMSTLRRWHADHQLRRPVEHQAWEAMLTFWVLGGAGLPVSMLLEWPAAAACLATLATPPFYIALRRHLHRRHRLRCDWLSAGEPGR